MLLYLSAKISNILFNLDRTKSFEDIVKYKDKLHIL